MPNRTDVVAGIKTWLEARGQTWRTNEDAFQITGRVAWVLREEGARLVVKRPDQNGADVHGHRYSHDAIAFPTGWVDCLVSAGPPANVNGPGWEWHDGAMNPDATAAPFDLDAGIVTPPAPPGEPDVPAIPDDADVMQVLGVLLSQVTNLRTEVTNLRGEVLTLRLADDRGLSGSLFGYTLTLHRVPAPP